MALPPFTYTHGYNGHQHYAISLGGGLEAWDDSEVNEAYEYEKACGNIYVPEGEESMPPGNWVPVTTASPHGPHVAWTGQVASMMRIAPVSPVPVIPSTLPPLVPSVQIKRGKGKLYKTVYPSRKGKLYEAVISNSGSSNSDCENNGKECKESQEVDMAKLMESAYKAGYQDGFEAAARAVEHASMFGSPTGNPTFYPDES